MKLALDERGMKVQGKTIKYITRDDETKAGSATRRAEEAVDADGVKYIIGPWSSGVALAVSEVAKRKKVFHYFSGHRGHLGRALSPLLLPVGGEPVHRGQDGRGHLHAGQPQGEALAPAGRRLRIRLVGGEIHQGSGKDPRDRVRRGRPAP